MSDFMNGLLERHLGVGEAVRPRSPSRFEPNTGPPLQFPDHSEPAEATPHDPIETNIPVSSPEPEPPRPNIGNTQTVQTSVTGVHKLLLPHRETSETGLLSSSGSDSQLREIESLPLSDSGTPEPEAKPPDVQPSMGDSSFSVPPNPASAFAGDFTETRRESPVTNDQGVNRTNVFGAPPLGQPVPQWDGQHIRYDETENEPVTDSSGFLRGLLSGKGFGQSIGQSSSIHDTGGEKQAPVPLVEAVTQKNGNSFSFPVPLTETGSHKNVSFVDEPASTAHSQRKSETSVFDPSLDVVLPRRQTEIDDNFVSLRQMGEQIRGAVSKEPEPVINVSIGRIEVRAVQPRTQPSQRPRNKKTGVMSLDKYLSQCGR